MMMRSDTSGIFTAQSWQETFPYLDQRKPPATTGADPLARSYEANVCIQVLAVPAKQVTAAVADHIPRHPLPSIILKRVSAVLHDVRGECGAVFGHLCADSNLLFGYVLSDLERGGFP